MVLAALGSLPYKECLVRPSLGQAATQEGAGDARCKEGGSIYAQLSSSHFGARVHKKFMVFYTPRDARGPVLEAVLQGFSALGGATGGAYSFAKQRCYRLLIKRRVYLNQYLRCVSSVLKSYTAVGLSPFRGFAAVVQAPLRAAYSMPGYSSPRGHVLVEEFDLGHLRPRKTSLRGVIVWLFSLGPVALPI